MHTVSDLVSMFHHRRCNSPLRKHHASAPDSGNESMKETRMTGSLTLPLQTSSLKEPSVQVQAAHMSDPMPGS